MSVIKNGCVMRVMWLCYVSEKERLCYESDIAVSVIKNACVTRVIWLCSESDKEWLCYVSDK